MYSVRTHCLIQTLPSLLLLVFCFSDFWPAAEGGVDDQERVGADDAGGHHPLPGQKKVLRLYLYAAVALLVVFRR